MKNRFEILGQTTRIILRLRTGEQHEAIIDTDDLARVNSFPKTWCLAERVHTTYVYGMLYPQGEKPKVIYLHRFILGAPGGLVIDHIDGNGLNNCRANLRVVTIAQNSQNRKGASRRNKTSGIRGVSWDQSRQKWRATVAISENGKPKQLYLGRFSTIEEAAVAAVAGRRKHLPFSEN